MSTQQIVVQALGRPSFLGQLYSGKTGNLLNGSLFPTAAVEAATRESKLEQSVLEYKNVKNSKDRAESLNVSASISVSIMGGALELKGFGAYLDSTDTTSESVTITGAIRTTTVNRRLEVNNFGLQSSVVMPMEKIRKTGATHVVTGIIYGGNMIGSVTETTSTSDEKKDIRGQFMIKALKSLGSLAGAKGSADLSIQEKENLKNSSLEIRLVADYLGADLDPSAFKPEDAEMIKLVPVTLSGLARRLALGPKFLGVGVPVELTLTPLNQFNKISAELLFRELREDDLSEIMNFYDKLALLSQKRIALLVQINQGSGDYFPSFSASCQESSERVELLVIKARGELGNFLRKCREQIDVPSGKATADFILKWTETLRNEQNFYTSDAATWKRLLSSKDAASNGLFPFTTVPDLSAAMISKEKIPIALVLIPPKSLATEVQNTYRDLAVNMRRLCNAERHQSQDSSSGPPELKLCSIYTDPSIEDTLLALDGDRGAIKHAMEKSVSTKVPCVLTFGFAPDNLGFFDWRSSTQDEWGMIYNSVDNSQYIGELKDGVPHGIGVMSYADRVTYQGSWFQGSKDGIGIISRDQDGTDVVIEEGVYVDNTRQPNGRVVRVVVMDPDVPVKSATVAVQCHFPDAAAAKVDQIQQYLPAQVERFAKVFGWQPGEKYRLTTVWESQAYLYTTEGVGQLRPNVYATHQSSSIVYADGPKFEYWNYGTMHYDWQHSDRDVDNDGLLILNPWLVGTAGYFVADDYHTRGKDLNEFGIPAVVEAVRILPT